MSRSLRIWSKNHKEVIPQMLIQYGLSHQPYRRFVIGGPRDSGVTGRKLSLTHTEVMERMEGFSGKDPSKVSKRCLCWAAKNIWLPDWQLIANTVFLCYRCCKTDSVHVDTYGTENL